MKILLCILALCFVMTSSTDQAMKSLPWEEVNRLLSQLEQNKSSESFDISFLELLLRMERNFKEILRNPGDLGPYLNIVNDSTFNTAKFFFEPNLRQQAKSRYLKRREAYTKAGIKEDDLYN